MQDVRIRKLRFIEKALKFLALNKLIVSPINALQYPGRRLVMVGLGHNPSFTTFLSILSLSLSFLSIHQNLFASKEWKSTALHLAL